MRYYIVPIFLANQPEQDYHPGLYALQAEDEGCDRYSALMDALLHPDTFALI